MSGYPSQPPDQQQYNFLDSAQQDQLQFGPLGQPIFPKVDDANRSYSPSAQTLVQELHDASLNGSTQQQILQATQQQPASIDQLRPMAPETNVPEGMSDQPQKANRLRKACDSCSIRKVKCDESGPPCKACAALQIPCTFDRPTRRRGPPNRHADAIKRRRLEDTASSYLSAAPDPSSSPTHAAQALAALSSQSDRRNSVESICSTETVDFLVEDFFCYVYPLCPFPHEPSFREAWKRREDRVNRSFLALLCAMIGALVTSLSRKARLYLTAQQRGLVPPDYTGLAYRCQQLCISARGPSHAVVADLTVYDAATSFFLAMMGSHGQNPAEHRYYLGECLNIVQILEDRRIASVPHAGEGVQELDTHDSHITLETCRRILGAAFIDIRGSQQLRAGIDPPTTFSLQHVRPPNPLPLEIEDTHIYLSYLDPTHSDPQSDPLLPLVAGFNAIIRVLKSYDSSLDPSLTSQRKSLLEASRRCRAILAGLPPQIRLVSSNPAGSEPSSRDLPSGYNQPRFLREPLEAWADPPLGHLDAQHHHHQERRENQYRAQRAAVHTIALRTRLYLVSSYWSEPDESTSTDDEEMSRERDDAERDILLVLGNVDQINTVPIQQSEILSLARALVEGDHKGQLASQSERHVIEFLGLLSRLEDPAYDILANSDGLMDDWARVKDLQTKFADPDSFFRAS